MAESWLAGQEPLVRAAELGSNVDEVESLIKRHEAFEKLAAGWEDRFTLLEKLTTVCLFVCIPTQVEKKKCESVYNVCHLILFSLLAGGKRDSEKKGRRREGPATAHTSPSGGRSCTV